MSKHTPGPWEVDRNSTHAGAIANIFHCLGNDWVEVWSKEWPDSEEIQEANARLIAAAPELLLALEMSIDALRERAEGYGEPDHADDLKRALAAIAKAKGGE